MIFTDDLTKLINNHLEKSGYSRNKVASISNYSYLDIEGQMTSLIRMSTDILGEEQSSRRYKKEFYGKHALKKDIWKFINSIKKTF